jgi:hypothetical protein
MGCADLGLVVAAKLPARIAAAREPGAITTRLGLWVLGL